MPATAAGVGQANALAAGLGSPADAETFTLARTYQSGDGDLFATALTQLRADQAAAIEAAGTLEALIPGAETYDRGIAHVGVARDADGAALGGYYRVASGLGTGSEVFEATLAEARAALALDVASDPLAASPAYGYWRADALDLADGAALTGWEDLSGVGDATIATTAPIYREGGGVPYVECDGSDHLAVPARLPSRAPADTEQEIWIVCEPSVVTGNNYLYGPVSTGGGIAVVSGFFAVYNPNFNQRLSYVEALAGTRYLVRLRYTGAGNGNYALNVDSSDGTTNSAGGQAWFRDQPHMIARRRNGAFEKSFQGKIYAIWHPEGRITGADEAGALQYFQDTWGVSTPARYA